MCKKCSASSRETCSERSGGKMPLPEKGVRGRGGSPCPRPAHRSPGGRQRSGHCLLVSRNGSLNVKAVVHAEVFCDDVEPVLGGSYHRSHCASDLGVRPD